MPSIGDATSITRADLLRFPKPTADIILSLQKNGWRVSINKNTHARLLAPDGVTIVGATTNKNSHVYLQQQVLKYNAGEPIEEPAKATTSEKVRCPRPDCGRWFSDLDHLNIHINVDHENMTKCPDCDYTHRLARIVMIHRSKSHGYESPSKARRKELARLKTQVVGDEAAFENRCDSWQHEELGQGQIMDEAEILAIEPIGLRTETRRQSYTSDALDLKPVPPAPASEFIEAMGPAKGQAETFDIQSAYAGWEDVTLTGGVREQSLQALINAYLAVGLEVRLQVRNTK